MTKLARALRCTLLGCALAGVAVAATADPAAVAPPPAVEVESVSIAINASPWARIEIDGRPVGETPLSGVRVPIGRHRFVAHMPDGSVRERVIHVDRDHEAVIFDD